jgi:hypothetical protein
MVDLDFGAPSWMSSRSCIGGLRLQAMADHNAIDFV